MTMNLHEQLVRSVRQAQEALQAGNLEEATKHRQAAEQVKSQIEEWKRIQVIEESAQALEPMRPPLPMMPASSSDSTDADIPPTHRMAYYNRFGEPQRMVDQILRELHGPNYMGLYWSQRNAFVRYLRRGYDALSPDERAMERQVVFTPKAVMSAIESGIDSVKALKQEMVTASDLLGGFMVPVDRSSQLIERIAGLAVIRPRATVITTSRDRVEMPFHEDAGGDTTGRYTSPVRVGWVEETPDQITFSTFKPGTASLNIHMAMAGAELSRNLLEDSTFPIEDYLMSKFAEAVAFDEDDRCISGAGVGTLMGILPGKQNVMGVQEVMSGSATAPYITWDQVMAVPFTLPAQYRTGAVWIMNRKTALQIHQLKNPSSGEYYWQNYNQVGGQAGPQRVLLDYPVLEQESMPDVAIGSIPILFGNPSAYMLADRIGMTIERYVDSETARRNKVLYILRRRTGGRLMTPWSFVAFKIGALP